MSFLPRRSSALTIEIPRMNRHKAFWSKAGMAAATRGLKSGIRAATIDITAAVQRNLDGPVLNRRTGRLYKSITPEVFTHGGRVVGIVGTAVKYAPVHEFGATIRPKESGGKLSFRIDGRFIQTKQVTIPRRPFMARAFESRSKAVVRLINRHVQKSIAGTLERRQTITASKRRGVGFNAD